MKMLRKMMTVFVLDDVLTVMQIYVSVSALASLDVSSFSSGCSLIHVPVTDPPQYHPKWGSVTDPPNTRGHKKQWIMSTYPQLNPRCTGTLKHTNIE